MYSSITQIDLEAMRREASKLRQEYLEYAEDLELVTKPEFWSALADAEAGKVKKLTLGQLRKELGLSET